MGRPNLLGFTIFKLEWLQANDPILDKDIYPWAHTHWSRPYEYAFALTALHAHVDHLYDRIHNTAAGLHATHSMQWTKPFAHELDQHFASVSHTDLLGEHCYDLTRPWLGHPFYAALCISALEHLEPPQQHLALLNLIHQLEPGGHLIATFDHPGIDLDFLESLLGVFPGPDLPKNALTGRNSATPSPKPKDQDTHVLALHLRTRD